jgi:hypothetical protein
MLEYQGLALGPWADEDGERRRIVSVPASGNALGFVRAHGTLGSRWSWLARRSFEVFETEDASLLMSVYRPWGPFRGWSVFDAEDRRVAFIYRQSILDGAGERLAWVRPVEAGRGQFFAPGGAEVGSFELRHDRSLLTFGEALEGKPFARMALLGAVLSWS